MKTRNLLIFAILTLFVSSCVVFSFYPLYTSDDLFENDLLLGEWVEDDYHDSASTSTDIWKFEHPFIGAKENGVRNKKSYILTLKSTDDGEVKTREFSVHIIKIADTYFLDFYTEDHMDPQDISLWSLHMVPVHTFAKLTVEEDKLAIQWFDPDWLEKLIKENRIRIHHEDNGDFILLTAKPKELQKFVKKYVDAKDAFDDGLEVELFRKE